MFKNVLKTTNILKPPLLRGTGGIIFLNLVTFLILFISSSVRHLLFQSNALDLGWFDQAIYLISQGLPPIVSFVDYHILGDHAAFIFYPIALLYKIYSSVYWLFFIQALALSLATIPIYKLANQAGLKNNQGFIIALVYLLYPLVFNVNLFDFHPEVIAIPTVFWAILAARNNCFWGFILALVVILACKAILSLTVLGLGIWLLLFEKKRIYGMVAIILGLAWFMITTQVIIPYFTGRDAALEMADNRYSYLGNTLGEIITNLFLNPSLILSKVFNLKNLEYLLLLFAPLAWGLAPASLSTLIPALPALILNLITDYAPQKNLTQQYSVPILPFLILAVITSYALGKTWLKRPKWIITWSIIAFLALAKYGYFGSLYLDKLDTWQATRAALAQIQTQGGVLTTSNIAPHLTHRKLIKLAIEGSQELEPTLFNYILLNQTHPGWNSSDKLIKQWREKIEDTDSFRLSYEEEGVFLYIQNQP